MTATIEFSPFVTVTNGTIQMFGLIDGLEIPFPLHDKYPCKNHGLDCPLKSGVTYSLEVNLPMKTKYPKCQLIAEMDVKLPGEKYLFCFKFPIKID